MKRKYLLGLVLLVLMTGSVFADGWGGRGCGGGRYGGGPGRGWHRGDNFDAEEVELTGVINWEEDRMPLLKSGGVDYALMIPYFIMEEIGLEDGTEITAEGYVLEPMLSGYDIYGFHPEVITANGETYDAEDFRPCYGPDSDDEDDRPRRRRRNR